jgi:hypothetical protein
MRPYESQRYNCIPSPRKKHEKSGAEGLKRSRGTHAADMIQDARSPAQVTRGFGGAQSPSGGPALSSFR